MVQKERLQLIPEANLKRHICLRNVKDPEPTDDEKRKDRTWKARLFLDHFREWFRSVEFEEYVAIDEQMVSFTGRSIIRQLMPAKPIKFGFKVLVFFMVCSAFYNPLLFLSSFGRWPDQMGMCMIFTHVREKQPPKKKEAHEMGVYLRSFVVLMLVNQIPDAYKGVKVFADNYFSSVPLVKELLKQGHFYVGTLRKDQTQKAPLKSGKELKNRGDVDHVVSEDGSVVLVRWKDNNDVTFISSYKGVSPEGEVLRYNRSKKEKLAVRCPAVVNEYNSNMGGVDLSDFLQVMYEYSVRSRQWYIYFFNYVLQMSIRNAAVLYRRDVKALGFDKKLDLKEFIWSVTDVLASKSEYKTKRAIQRPIPEENRYDGKGHWGEVHREEGRDARERLCKTGKTDVWCSKCDLPLCFRVGINCFYDYHN